MEEWKFEYRKSFRKDFKKLDRKDLFKWINTLELFLSSPTADHLRRHKLKGKYKGLESIDVSPDLRALFRQEGGLVIFHYIRNHNQLYN